MCNVCGCAGGGATLETDHGHHHHGHDHDHHHDHDHGHGHDHDHGHHHDQGHSHDHDHAHEHRADGTIDYGTGPARAHVPGLSQSRMIEIERGILAKNDEFAEANRARFGESCLFAVNLLSSPGAGKTTLLVETLKALSGKIAAAVIEGDQQTSNDADRIRATGAPAIQINTGKGCHLDAQMVGRGVDALKPKAGGLLLIENVGNLVCPAGFDLGEAQRITLVSVTEGEDKPLKYPDAFTFADLVLVTKTDLAPHLDFDLELLKRNIARINPSAEVVCLSSKSREGFDAWLAWLAKARADWIEDLAREAEARAAQLRRSLTQGLSA